MSQHVSKRKWANFLILSIITSILIFSGFGASIGNYSEDSDIDLKSNLYFMEFAQKTPLNFIGEFDHTIRMEFTFSTEDFVRSEFGEFDILILLEEELLENPGEPVLPFKPVTIVLPSESNLDSAIITTQIKERIVLDEDYYILPGQEPRTVSDYSIDLETKSESEIASEFELDTEIYTSSKHYPNNIIQKMSETEFNGLHLGHFGIIPAQYNPLERQITIFTKIHVNLAFPEVETAQYESITLNEQDIEPIIQFLDNPEDIDNFYEIGSNSRARNSNQKSMNLPNRVVHYVVITNSSNYYDNFLPLVQWKTKKGVPAEIIDEGWIRSAYSGNDTQEKIRNFIKDAKETWGTKYVLLGGDISVIPYRKAYGKVGSYPADYTIPSDLYYSDLDGNWDADADRIYGETTDNVNLYPDVYVGRAPVESTAEVDNFVQKTLFYEKNSTDGYQLDMLFMAEKLDSNTDAGISKSYIGTQYVPSRFNITKLYQTLFNLSTTSALAQMSMGKGITNHAGHCNWNVMSIGTSRLLRSDVDKLTNKEKQGILYTIGCITTAFENNDCIAEHFVKNTKGGTVSFIGNSRYGWYAPGSPIGGVSNRYDQGFFNQLLQNDIYNIGETFAVHKAQYVSWSASNGAWRWVQFCLNLLGDPELPVWTDLPENLSVKHPTKVYFGPQTLRVEVNDTYSNPIDNATVCLQGEDVYLYSVTDSNGIANFNINPISNRGFNVTVTKHNYYPYEGFIDKIIDDYNPPKMVINNDEYGWFNQDPGSIIDVAFDSLGETDLSKAEYSSSPLGPWHTIFNTPRQKFYNLWSISEIWDSLPEGYNKICVRVNDSAQPNHWTMGNITFKKDTTPPEVTINNDQYGWYTSDPGAVVDVDFANNSINGLGSPLIKAEYCVNSDLGPWRTIFNSFIGEYTTDWSVLWSDLVDGENLIHIRLYDEAGNEDITTDNIIFKRDTNPPAIIVRDNVYGWFSNDPDAIIDVDFSNGGNGSSLTLGEYKIGEGGSWKVIFNEECVDYILDWSVVWDELTEGNNTIYMRLFDFVGFEDITEDNITIMKDTTSPRITVNKHVYGWYTTDPGAVIDVDFNNVIFDSSPLDYARYRVLHTPMSSATGPWRMIFDTDVKSYTMNWSVKWSDLWQGNNTIEVQVYDLASNKNITIDTIYILKDIEPPKITVNKAEYGWFKDNPGNVIDVDFSNNDNGSKLSYVEYKINNGVWNKLLDINHENYMTDWNVDWEMLLQGGNLVEIRVWDFAGFYQTDTITINKDTIDPEIVINKDTYGWCDSDPGTIIDVDFNKGDINSSSLDFGEYKVGINGDWKSIFDINISIYSSLWSVDWSLLEEGNNRIYFRTCDVAGNLFESSDYIIIKKDTLPPSIKVNKPSYGWFGGAIGNIINVDFSQLNSEYDQLSPSEQSNLSKAQYKVSEIGPWIDIFNENTNEYTTDWNVTWDFLVQGMNTVYFRVFDTPGNIYYDTKVNITVYKDIEPPTVYVNQKIYGWYNSDPGKIIDVNFLAGDLESNSPLDLAQYRIGAYGDWIDIFTPADEVGHLYIENWQVPWKDMKEGLNNIFIRTFDQGGNMDVNKEFVILNKDTTGPEPPLLFSPINEIQITEKKPLHSWKEPFDPGANEVLQYHIQIDTSGTFTSNIVDTITTGFIFNHDLDLSIGTYYWRVQGIDTAGNIGDWSIVWSFEVVDIKTPDINLAPIADAGEDFWVFVNEEVAFNASGSSDPENDPLTYLWYFDDDYMSDGFGLSVKWKFKSNGTFDVILEVFDNCGNYDSDTVKVQVIDLEVDTDNDGMSDDWERYYGLDPDDPNDGTEDSDNDGYENLLEFGQGSAPQDTQSTPITANDKTPPKITHAKIKSGEQLSAIDITATVVDDESGIKTVNLYYKKTTDKYYNSVSMGSANPYATTIPGSMATLDDLEYYIEAVDNSKARNTAYFGDEGQVLLRPSQVNDIDLDIKEKITTEKESDIVEDFQDTFDFASLEICFLVIILLIVILISFGLSLRSAVYAKLMAEENKQQKTIKVTRGKNMLWEGSSLEDISEDEDLNLIEDSFELD